METLETLETPEAPEARVCPLVYVPLLLGLATADAHRRRGLSAAGARAMCRRGERRDGRRCRMVSGMCEWGGGAVADGGSRGAARSMQPVGHAR